MTGTQVDKVYEAIRRKGARKGKAARIAQAQTGKALATGRKPKGKRKHALGAANTSVEDLTTPSSSRVSPSPGNKVLAELRQDKVRRQEAAKANDPLEKPTMKKDLEGFRLGLDGAAVADHFGAVGFDPEAAMTPDMYEKPKAAVRRPSKQRTTKKRTPPTAVESKEWMQRMEKGIAAARARGIGPPPSPAAATPERITIKSAERKSEDAELLRPSSQRVSTLRRTPAVDEGEPEAATLRAVTESPELDILERSQQEADNRAHAPRYR